MDRPDSDLNENSLGDGKVARFVDRPTSVAALQDVVRTRASDGLALYPQGGRMSLNFGGTPRREGVAVDLSGLNQVIEYPAADMTITVESGITLAALAKLLDTEGQRLEIDAPQAEFATIGGVYATNSTGPRRYGSGRPRDQIIGVGFVTADGNVVKGGGRVVKNVAGYDFPKLIAGSMGSLGIISHVTVKVRPKPEAKALAFVTYRDLNTVAVDLVTLNTSSTRPVAIELLNQAAIGRLGVNLPDATLAISLLFEDSKAAVEWQSASISRELKGKVDTIFSDVEAMPVQSAIQEFPAKSFGPISFVANLPYSFTPQFLAGVDAGVWAVQCHAGNGVVRAHGVVDDLARLEMDVERLRAQAESAGGSLIVNQCPTDRKNALRVWGNPRPDWAWSEKVKAALDPGGVMNPGRFIGNI